MAGKTHDTDLFEYLLRLGDDSLVLGQRLSEWTGHAPELELDIALGNLALDLIGQARAFLSYAGKIDGKGRDEDDLAMSRDVLDFRNVLLVEQPNGDFGQTVVRHFLFSTYRHLLFGALKDAGDAELAAIAGKALKETAYHVRFSTDWVVRLGDGTDESHARMTDALEALWRFHEELFAADDVEARLSAAGLVPEICGPEIGTLKAEWEARVGAVLTEATLEIPAPRRAITGGRQGHHGEHLGHLLSEMQYLQRAYPGAEW